MEHWLLMYNPASGKSSRIRSQLDRIIEIFQAKDNFITTYRLDRTTPSDLETALDSAHYDGIIACGGDGSVKYIVRESENEKTPQTAHRSAQMRQSVGRGQM